MIGNPIPLTQRSPAGQVAILHGAMHCFPDLINMLSELLFASTMSTSHLGQSSMVSLKLIGLQISFRIGAL